ncbi:hypothetical protein IEQ34_026584 [Dendrobium chrysotoxum]|uniref:Uncharacterized protein n=1 Tax=Dendrobium chrysotoxum TaxID=161865 RepID=A0AAV7FMD3_DENCH|nr:hypothetical protein IEQ34_026584 [Dendrobium chrysotoxum]
MIRLINLIDFLIKTTSKRHRQSNKQRRISSIARNSKHQIILLAILKEKETYLGAKAVVVLEKGVMIGKKGVIGGLKAFVVSLELLRLPAGAAVLEPHGHLPRLQPKLLRQLALLLGF